jgi:hypothetical protein
MSSLRARKSPQELAELILKHDPTASHELIRNVISEWGDFWSDHRFDTQCSIDSEPVQPKEQQRSGTVKK